MIKTFRQVKEKVSTATGPDADDKRRLKELEEAVIAFDRTLGYYVKSLADSAANTAALHIDLANLYPARQRNSIAVMQLTAAGAVFKDAPAIISEIVTAFEKPVADMRARIKQLLALADQRQVCRAEIAHYREKVTRLANDGLANVKAQAKAESNQAKLFQNQKTFQELDSEITTALAQLDNEIAAMVNSAVTTYITEQARFAAGTMHCFSNALAAIPGATGAAYAATYAGGTVSPAAAAVDTITAATAGAGVPAVVIDDASAAGPDAVSLSSFLSGPTTLVEAGAVPTPAALTQPTAAAVSATGASPERPHVAAAPAPSNPFASDADFDFPPAAAPPTTVKPAVVAPEQVMGSAGGVPPQPEPMFEKFTAATSLDDAEYAVPPPAPVEP